MPAAHPYVENLLDPVSSSTVHLVDPPPVGGADGRWWPPSMLTAGWIETHASEFDVLHVHFGMESFTTAELEAALDALDRAGRPLVYTLHDLTNPQLVEQTLHDEHVALMVRRAAEVVTLTEGAARYILTRWNRVATVIEHPNIVPLDRELDDALESGVAATDVARPAVVGVHFRDLRPNIAAVETTRSLALALGVLRQRGLDVEVRIDVNSRVRDEAARDEVRCVAAETRGMTLLEHDRFDDRELERSISATDVSLVPYLHGTHSGWVELCFDLGVPVVGGDIGFVAEQHPDAFIPADLADPESLAAALTIAFASSSPRAGSAARRALVAERRETRREARRGIASAHEEIYERALSVGGVT